MVPGTLLVEHRDNAGEIARYDFAELPCAGPMRASLAALFAQRCTRAGGWTSHATSQHNWYMVRTFAIWLSERDNAPEDLDALTAKTWKEWRLSRPANTLGLYHVTDIARLLRGHLPIHPAVRGAMAERMPQITVKEQSFTPEEFARISATARRVFRAAHLRIMGNAAVLEAWRGGRITDGSDAWLVGEALDCMARTGEPPSHVASAGKPEIIRRYVKPLGGANSLCTWRRLFLSRHEATALAVLLTIGHGLNLSTVSTLRVPRAAPDPGEDGFPVYRLELEKRRRGAGRRFETRNLADFGAASPGRLITQALQATSFARALVHAQAPEVDRLLAWRSSWGKAWGTRMQEARFGLFGVGVNASAGLNWSQTEGISASPFRRGRRTANVHHRREPGQNSQDTHDRVYVLPDKQVQQGAVGDIAAGVVAALESARRAVLGASLRDAADPQSTPTATADCDDIDNSPFTELGSACAASFLLCLACTNARIHPGHHPRLAYLHQALDNLRSVMDPALWSTDWKNTHERLEDLGSKLGRPVWTRASGETTQPDRDMIDHLLKGDLDQ
jgi:hypothetical protein